MLDFNNTGESPGTVFLQSPHIFLLFHNPEKDQPFRIVHDRSHPNLDDAKEELLNHLPGIWKRVIVPRISL